MFTHCSVFHAGDEAEIVLGGNDGEGVSDQRDSLLLPLALFALTLISVSPCGAEEAPIPAELNLFSVVVILVSITCLSL